MPDSKITNLTGLNTVTNTSSVIPIVDLDEPSEADQNKKITFVDLATNVSTVLGLSGSTVSVSGNDTTPNFLANKLVAGGGGNITVTELNDGGNETLEIEFIGSLVADPYVDTNYTGTLPVASGTSSFASGVGALATTDDTLAHGDGAMATAFSAHAWGPSAEATAINAFQFNTGTNSTLNTMQYLTTPVANDNSVLTQFVAPANYTPATATELDSHLAAIDVALAGAGGGNPYIVTNYAGTLPVASGVDSYAAGPNATSTGDDSFSQGDSASATALRAHAWGPAANATASDAYQFNTGTNSTTGTMQWINTPIANINSLLTQFIAPTHYTPAAPTEIDSHLTALDASHTQVRMTAADTTPNYLNLKLTVSQEGRKILQNPGAAEFLEIQVGLVLATEVAANPIATDGSLIPVDSTAAARTVTPPATPAYNDSFGIIDSRGTSATNNITIDFITAGDNFHGTSANYILNTNTETAKFRYLNATVGWMKV